MPPRTIKVAVVGSGLAGLTAAYLLQTVHSQNDSLRFQVHLFEKAESIGMDAASVSIPLRSDGEKSESELRVDVPMRSFQGGYYPHLLALYKHLGVDTRHRDYSYTFSILSPSLTQKTPTMRTTMIYNGASGRGGLGIPSLLLPPRRSSLSVRDMGLWLRDALPTYYAFVLMTMWLVIAYVVLLVLSMPVFRPPSGETFRSWADRRAPAGLLARWTGANVRWEAFIADVVVPLFSAVCTCPINDVWNHPAEEILEYIWLTLGTHHYVVTHGSRAVASLITRPLPPSQIHLSHSVTSLARDPRTNLTSVSFTDCSSYSSLGEEQRTGVMDGFAHVILATQANHAVPLLSALCSSLPLGDPSLAPVLQLRECAASVFHCSAEVINHSFEGLLPCVTRDRRDLNLVLLKPSSESAGEHAVMATHVIPTPESCSPQTPTYQTTNPTHFLPLPSEHLISRTVFSRAVLTPASKLLLETHLISVQRPWCATKEVIAGPAQGGKQAGIWLVGSWCGGGIPLLEGCVVSAKCVVRRLLREEGAVLQRDDLLEKDIRARWWPLSHNDHSPFSS